MHAWLPLVFLLASPRSPATPLHKIEVKVAGPLAVVEVWRAVEANTRIVDNRQQETFLDLDLPEGAAVLDWEVVDRNERVPLAPQTEVQASAGLEIALKLRKLSLATAQMDDGTDYRVHLTPIADGEQAVLHYRYTVVAGCAAGRLLLRMPENLAESPIPAEVTVTIAPLPDGLALAEASLASHPADIHPGTRRLVMRGTAPARKAWEIAWRYARQPGAFPGQVLAAGARVPRIDMTKGRPRQVPQYELAGLACRDVAAPRTEVPARVLLLLDRSRSVGPGGISAERALARALVEALPPSVLFDAIVFGAEATPVFALPRMPTREALDAFSVAADPNLLENGTDVALALARARTMIDLGGDGGAGVTWVVLLTDGALPADQTAVRMQKALAGGSAQKLNLLVLLLRQRGDDEVPASAITQYARLARNWGGLLRVVPPGSVGDTARGILDAMARGGDLLDVRLESRKLSDVLPPGRGASIVLTDPARLPKQRRVRFSARGLDAEVFSETTPAQAKREWLDALIEPASGRRRAWSGATSGMAITVLPAIARTSHSKDSVVHGRMDPTVLRNALSLAFMPRARACYLSRKVAKAGDTYLRGRMKLELDIERGELQNAVVRSSTLGNPEIEDCVRKAAWAVEYPRPVHRDAPTTAFLNLVFRPHTPQERPPDASPMDREIDLILGPLSFPTDYQDLLQDKAPDKSPGQ